MTNDNANLPIEQLGDRLKLFQVVADQRTSNPEAANLLRLMAAEMLPDLMAGLARKFAVIAQTYAALGKGSPAEFSDLSDERLAVALKIITVAIGCIPALDQTANEVAVEFDL